jgi:leucyl-tRNA synthetase
LSILLRTLYPIAPHITDALWNELGFAAEFGEILNTPWPKADEAALAQDEIQLVVQVNGKLRGHIAVPRWADEREIEFAALGDANVQRFVAGQEVKRVVVAPKIPPFKLVNLVV